jgi:hypothetical protein
LSNKCFCVQDLEVNSLLVAGIKTASELGLVTFIHNSLNFVANAENQISISKKEISSAAQVTTPLTGFPKKNLKIFFMKTIQVIKTTLR